MVPNSLVTSTTTAGNLQGVSCRLSGSTQKRGSAATGVCTFADPAVGWHSADTEDEPEVIQLSAV